VTEDVSAREGLARLAAYGGARAVPAFEHSGRRTLWFAAPDQQPPTKPDVVIFSVGLTASEGGAVYARIATDKQVFLVSTSAASERLTSRIARGFEGATVLRAC
jgi:hypothetical protein